VLGLGLGVPDAKWRTTLCILARLWLEVVASALGIREGSGQGSTVAVALDSRRSAETFTIRCSGLPVAARRVRAVHHSLGLDGAGEFALISAGLPYVWGGFCGLPASGPGVHLSDPKGVSHRPLHHTKPYPRAHRLHFRCILDYVYTCRQPRSPTTSATPCIASPPQLLRNTAVKAIVCYCKRPLREAAAAAGVCEKVRRRGPSVSRRRQSGGHPCAIALAALASARSAHARRCLPHRYVSKDTGPVAGLSCVLARRRTVLALA